VSERRKAQEEEMTREQAIDRYRAYVAGCIALGATKFRPRMKAALLGELDGVESFGQVLTQIDATAAELIGKLYDAITPKEPDNARPVNGQPTGNRGANPPQPR
jgi:hypothetical protein